MGHHIVRASPTQFTKGLFAGLPGRYDALAAVLSFGQDRRWRREMIDHVVPASPATVLDVATGPAGVALQLADRTKAHILGIDLSAEMLARGKHNVRAARAESRIALVRGQGERLPFPDATFDALTFTYLLRYVADPSATIHELARVVRPGGTMASLEFAVPPNPFWRWCWVFYTRIVLPAAGGLLGGRAWFDVGRFLGPNISGHYDEFPIAETIEAWRAAGFVDVRAKRMSLGGGLVMWGQRGSDPEQSPQ
jgi:demethylmenaquinone methyltransferase/2-methoxy-6-polyprenyl-1,4-benzoquinol methylase